MSIKYGTKDITDIPGITKVYHGLDLVFQKSEISWELLKEEWLTRLYKIVLPPNKEITITLNTADILIIADDLESESEDEVIYYGIMENDIHTFKTPEVINRDLYLATTDNSQILKIEAGG